MCIRHGPCNVRRILHLLFPFPPLIAWQVEYTDPDLFQDGGSVAFTNRYTHRRVIYWWFARCKPQALFNNTCLDLHLCFLVDGHHRTQSRAHDDHGLPRSLDRLRSTGRKLDLVCVHRPWTVGSGRLLAARKRWQPRSIAPRTQYRPISHVIRDGRTHLFLLLLRGLRTLVDGDMLGFHCSLVHNRCGEGIGWPEVLPGVLGSHFPERSVFATGDPIGKRHG